MPLQFDGMTHTYRDQQTGKLVPSVTTILKASGLITEFYQGTEARDFGTLVHDGVRYHYTEDDANFHRIVDVVQQWDMDKERQWWDSINRLDEWLDKTGFKIRNCERIVHNRLLGYCGTLDIDGHDRNGDFWILDIKTGSTVPAWTRLQLAAYDLADGAIVTRKKARRGCIHLRPDKCRLMPEYTEIGDYSIWKELVKKYHAEI